MTTLDEGIRRVTEALNAELDTILQATISEVTDLRHRVAPGDVDDDPHALHLQLLEARRATDRTEELTAFIARVHSGAQRNLQLKKQEVEDAEAAAMTSQGPNPWGDDYATAKEKNARLLVQTTEQRMALRKAERRLLLLQEVLDFCRQCHRGLNDSRRDLDLRIRLLTLQTSLEK